MTNLIANQLRSHVLFNNIEDSLFEDLLKRTRRIELKIGDILFHQDDPAERFFYIEEGQIKLSRISMAGQEKVIEIMSSGQTFAEAVMFMQRVSFPVSAQALIDSVVYAVPNQSYRKILEHSTDNCFRLLGDLSMRLHDQLQELDQLAQQNASYRLVRYLLNQVPEDCGNCVELDLDIPKQVLASKLSIKPESFSRLLSSLSQQGIITVEKKHIIINDIQKLREFE